VDFSTFFPKSGQNEFFNESVSGFPRRYPKTPQTWKIWLCFHENDPVFGFFHNSRALILLHFSSSVRLKRIMRLHFCIVAPHLNKPQQS